MSHPAECCGGTCPQPTPQDASHPGGSTALSPSLSGVTYVIQMCCSTLVDSVLLHYVCCVTSS